MTENQSLLKTEEGFRKVIAYYYFGLGVVVNTVGLISSIGTAKIVTGICLFINITAFVVFCITLKKYILYTKVTMLVLGMLIFPAILITTPRPEVVVYYDFVLPSIYIVSIKRKRDLILPVLNGAILAVIIYTKFNIEHALTFFLIFTVCLLFGSLFSQTMFSSFLNLENAYTVIADIAKKDKLTGIYNRFGLEESLKVRADTPCHAIMIDIDFFKSVNDTYGHDAGDEVLIKLGLILSRIADNYFIVSRWGGEEFLLISFKSKEDTLLTIKKIYEMVEKELIIKNQHIHISSGMSKKGLMSPELVAEADGNLYRSKSTGRNKFTYKMQDYKL